MEVVRFEIKRSQYEAIQKLAARLKIQPGSLVCLWLSQKIRKYQSALDLKKPIDERKKNNEL